MIVTGKEKLMVAKEDRWQSWAGVDEEERVNAASLTREIARMPILKLKVCELCIDLSRRTNCNLELL